MQNRAKRFCPPDKSCTSKAVSLRSQRLPPCFNKTSLRFHESLGFMAKEIGGDLALPTQASGQRDFDGAGEERVILVKTL